MQLMMTSSAGAGQEDQTAKFHHTIAYSGGVDSSLVATLLHQNAQTLDNNNHTVTAVMGLSPAVPMEQLDLARRVANAIGFDFTTTGTNEGQKEMYVANEGKACLACKTELYSTLQAVHRHSQNNNAGSSASSSTIISLYNGTNADDLQDPTRLGLIAAANFGVCSPLELTYKSDVRLAARHLNLPNWNTAASPCLRSRLALGVPATEMHLQQIGAAERFVRHELRDVINETTNLRVRLLPRRQVCLEIDSDHLDEAILAYHHNRLVWDDYFLNKLSFASFGVRAFRSGSVATDTSKTTEKQQAKDEIFRTTIVKEAYV